MSWCWMRPASCCGGACPQLTHSLPSPPLHPSPQPQACRTALHHAAAEGQLEACRYLVSREPSLVTRCTKSGNTPLHRAAAYGHAEVAALLLAARAPVDLVNSEGATPLSRAARWGHGEVARVLLQARANPAIPDIILRKPADWAQLKKHTGVLAVLQEGGRTASSPAAAGAGAAAAAAAAYSGGGASSGGGSSAAAAAAASGSSGSLVLPPGLPQPGVVLTVEGWMAKEGHFFRNWKNRWFLLEGRRLLYFAKPAAKKPQGVIHLAKGSDVIVEERYTRPFCFTVLTLTKKFILQAANEEEMAEWIECIQNNLTYAPQEEPGEDTVYAEEEA